MVDVPLIRLAWGRSGDKGDSANIGVIARHADYLAYLVSGPVRRFEVPGIDALNFLLANALGGGGIASLRMDPQGKALAQILLDHPIGIPCALAAQHGLVCAERDLASPE